MRRLRRGSGSAAQHHQRDGLHHTLPREADVVAELEGRAYQKVCGHMHELSIRESTAGLPRC